MSTLKKLILKKTILGVLCILCGCISGPKNDGRTFAEKMNGENYESTNVVLGVPVLERKPVLRKFSGQVYCGEGITQTQANNILVSLMHENQTVSTVSTDTTGKFIIAAPIDPEFTYQLSATGSCGNASKSLPKNPKEQKTEEVLYLRK